jgi:hypothetical protein
MGTGLHDESARGHVVAERVVHQIAAAKARREHGACRTPVVGGDALGFIDRAGRCVDALHLRTPHNGREATKRIFGAAGLLAIQQLVLARHGQACQCGARDHTGGIHALKNLAKSRRTLLGMGDQPRQGRHQGGFTLRRLARFQRIKEFTH